MELCCLTVCAPHRLIDLAVSSGIPPAGLMPVVVQYAGEAWRRSVSTRGRILQRVGGVPLGGERLLLRPRVAALAAVRFVVPDVGP